MAVRLLNLLSLLALLLMPLGMAAPAAASMPAAAAEHCSEPQPAPEHSSQDDEAQATHCGMCSALPAAGHEPVEAGLPRAVLELGPVATFDGITPDTETPPPRS